MPDLIDSKEKLLRTAEELFFKYGYEEVSGGGICEKAGLSRSRLQYYFTDKKQLASLIFKKSLASFHYNLSKATDYSVERGLRDILEYMSLSIVCLLDIVSKDASPSSFYSECMDAGIAAVVLPGYLTQSMGVINRESGSEYDEVHIMTFAKIFSNALSANTKKYKESFESNKNSNFFAEIYSDLYMKMLDIPLEDRKEIVKAAVEKKESNNIVFHSMYEVEVTKI